MTTKKVSEEELWVGFARDAMANYEPTGDAEDFEELVDEMITVASDYADAMLDEFEARFGATGGARSKKRRKSKTKRGTDDDDDAEDD